MKTEIKTITPAIAKEWIAKKSNPKNRNISEAAIANYSRAMKNGQWKLNGEAIIFDEDGILSNGHHRLHAIVRAGVSVQCLIVEGVKSDAFATYDAGMKRTASHVLQMADIKDATNVSSIISALIIYRAAIERSGSWNTYVRPNSQEILDEYNRYPDMFKLTSKVGRKAHGVASLSWIGPMIAYLLIDKHKDPEDLSYFMEKLGSGEMLISGDPILTLRNAYIRAKTEKLKGNSKSPNWYKNAFIIAWNAYSEGRRLSLIKQADHNKAIPLK